MLARYDDFTTGELCDPEAHLYRTEHCEVKVRTSCYWLSQAMRHGFTQNKATVCGGRSSKLLREGVLLVDAMDIGTTVIRVVHWDIKKSEMVHAESSF